MPSLRVVSISNAKIKAYTAILSFSRYVSLLHQSSQFALNPSPDYRVVACNLFHDAASILGSEVLIQFGVSELLLLAKDPSWKVRKHAILAFGPVSNMLDSQIVETGIFNSILVNSKVG